MLLELRLDERERQAGADEGDVALELQQVRNRADVVFVTVRQDEPDDVVEARLDRLEIRQDQVDTRLVLLGEEHAAVDDEELALVLEDGHVAADLAETAEGEDAQGALFEGRGFVDVRGHAASRMRRGIRSCVVVVCAAR